MSESNDQLIGSSIAALNESTGRVGGGFTLSGDKTPTIGALANATGTPNANTSQIPPRVFSQASPGQLRQL